VAKENFQSIFEQLKEILQQYEAGMVVTADTLASYSLDSKLLGPNGEPLFFGAVQVKKNYVSFYLMPVYIFPDLLDSISPALKKRMQGKSCFNFKTADPERFQELKQLTGQSIARVRKGITFEK
jgi:hypothetical protein